MMDNLFKIFVASSCVLDDTHAQMVGPGGVVNYGGGGRAGRRVSYGVVRDASKGFYLGGSSIEGLNGIYHRVEGLPRGCRHTGKNLSQFC